MHAGLPASREQRGDGTAPAAPPRGRSASPRSCLSALCWAKAVKPGGARGSRASGGPCGPAAPTEPLPVRDRWLPPPSSHSGLQPSPVTASPAATQGPQPAELWVQRGGGVDANLRLRWATHTRRQETPAGRGEHTPQATMQDLLPPLLLSG